MGEGTTTASPEAAPFISYGVPAGAHFPEEHLEPPLLQQYILLPIHRRRRRRCRCACSFPSACLFLSSIFLLLAAAAVFLLWPTDPSIKLVRLDLLKVRVVTNPSPTLSISMDLSLRVMNPNFFSLDYDSLRSSIAYRGRDLGFATSKGGRIESRGVSYVDAVLRLNAIGMASEVFSFIEDLAKGSIPFDTITEVHGKLQVLSLEIPIEGKISCAISVDPGNQTIVRQLCSTQ